MVQNDHSAMMLCMLAIFAHVFSGARLFVDVFQESGRITDYSFIFPSFTAATADKLPSWESSPDKFSSST